MRALRCAEGGNADVGVLPLAVGRGNTASQPAAGNVRGLATQADEAEDEEGGDALFAPLLDVEKMVRLTTFCLPHILTLRSPG